MRRNRPASTRGTRGCAVAVALALAAFPACAGEPTHRLDASRWLAAPAHVENLTVWPVFTDTPVDSGDLVSLAEATASGVAKVREKSGSGQVNELVLENRGDRPILVLAGTILKGGNQDRQVSDDVVIEARSEVPLGAFCVERGRWSAQREGRSTKGVFAALSVMAAKRIRASAQYGGQQSEVWAQVDRVNEKAEMAPGTATFLAVLEDNDAAALALRERFKRSVRAHFDGARERGEVAGVAYAVNGEPLSVRTFANEALFFSHLDLLLETMALEAQVAQRRARKAGTGLVVEPASAERVVAMVREIDVAEVTERDTKAANRLQVRTNARGGHSAAILPRGPGKDPRVVTEDWTAAVEVTGELRSRLSLLGALGYSYTE